MCKHETILLVSEPGRGAAVALWLLDGAIGRLIRKGTFEVGLPDGKTRRYGAGTLAIAIAIQICRHCGGSHSTRTLPSARPGWTVG